MDNEQLQYIVYVIAFYEQKKNQQHVAYPNVWGNVICYFHLVMPIDVDHISSWDCKRIDDYCSMHSVASFPIRIALCWLWGTLHASMLNVWIITQIF
jgi:hypothetical protein